MNRTLNGLLAVVLTVTMYNVTANGDGLPLHAIVNGHHVQPRADRLQHFSIAQLGRPAAAEVDRLYDELLSRANGARDDSRDATVAATAPTKVPQTRPSLSILSQSSRHGVPGGQQHDMAKTGDAG
jgi:hypothetical protein